MVYHCTGCKSFVTQPIGKFTKNEKSEKYTPGVGPAINMECEHCSGRSQVHTIVFGYHRQYFILIIQVGGPFFSGPLHNKEFIARVMQDVATGGEARFGTHTRMSGMLSLLAEVRWMYIVKLDLFIGDELGIRSTVLSRTSKPMQCTALYQSSARCIYVRL
jgi:tRNA (guanine26-N2/guanine27-N2)-dimethyltransferase